MICLTPVLSPGIPTPLLSFLGTFSKESGGITGGDCAAAPCEDRELLGWTAEWWERGANVCEAGDGTDEGEGSGITGEDIVVAALEEDARAA